MNVRNRDAYQIYLSLSQLNNWHFNVKYQCFFFLKAGEVSATLQLIGILIVPD